MVIVVIVMIMIIIIGSNCLIRALLCEIVPVKSFMFRSSPLSSAYFYTKNFRDAI